MNRAEMQSRRQYRTRSDGERIELARDAEIAREFDERYQQDAPEMCMTCTPELASFIAPTGALQRAGLLKIQDQ